MKKLHLTLLASASLSLILCGCEKDDFGDYLRTAEKSIALTCENRDVSGSPGLSSPYQTLVFSDEFNGPSGGDVGKNARPDCFTSELKCTEYGYTTGAPETQKCKLEGNNEHSNLADFNRCNWEVWDSPDDDVAGGGGARFSSNSVAVRDGNLVLSTRSLTSEPNAVCTLGKNCTTGGVSSLDRNLFKEGRMEIRAKLPYSPGAWAALWLFVDGNEQINRYSELDVLESPHDTGVNHVVQSVWENDRQNPVPESGEPFASYGKRFSSFVTTGEYHRYGVEARQGKVRYYIDNCYTGTMSPGDIISGATVAGSIQAEIPAVSHYLLLQLLISSKTPIKAAEFGNSDLLVDYVRLYE